MGRNIGTLGQQREALDLEFTYFGGQIIRVHPRATDGVELEFLEAGRDVDIAELEDLDFSKIDAMDEEQQQKIFVTLSKASAAGYQAILTALHRLIHPDDFALYWRLGMDNGQQISDRMSDIRLITTAVIEATTDFPTGPPSDSASGSATTSAPSEVVSPSQATPPAAPVPTHRRGTDLEIALALERGRPDMQEFYVMEAEIRETAAKEAAEQETRDQGKLSAAGLSAD
jgi:hypothetical protein